MKKNILTIFFFMTTVLWGIAQEHTKTLVATYVQGYTIPQSVYSIKDKQTQENVLKEFNKKTPFLLCCQEGKCGFASSASTTIKEGHFFVSGERSFYIDLKKREKISSEVILDEHFLVHSPLNTIEWDITDEEMEIAGKLCTKATCLADNGQIVTAWFCSEIPIPVGPSEYYQGLPGLIFTLEMGNMQYEIQKIEYIPNIKKITLSSTGKKMEKEQFDKLREEIYERHKGELSGNDSGIQIIRL